MTNSLKDRFDDYISKNKVTVKRDLANVRQFLIKHNTAIESGFTISKAVTQFAISKTPFTLIEGAFALLKDNTTILAFDDFFSRHSGWMSLDCEGHEGIHNVFGNVIETFESTSFTAKWDKRISGRILKTEIGQIGCKQWAYSHSNGCEFFFRPDEASNEKVLSFLIDLTMKHLNSSVFSVESEMRSIKLCKETLVEINSSRTEEYASYITRSLDKGINRSILFYGAPGTGKTTLACSLIKRFNFRTMRFRYSAGLNFKTMLFIVKHFGVEAILIDDFDHTHSIPSDSLLEFLEFANRETKLVIALSNSLKTFHPAIIRPGRFDEIIKIEHLDNATIRSILGSLYDAYGEKVKHWPVAHIKELVNKSHLVSEEKLNIAFEDLDERVKKQLEQLGDKKE